LQISRTVICTHCKRLGHQGTCKNTGSTIQCFLCDASITYCFARCCVSSKVWAAWRLFFDLPASMFSVRCFGEFDSFRYCRAGRKNLSAMLSSVCAAFSKNACKAAYASAALFLSFRNYCSRSVASLANTRFRHTIARSQSSFDRISVFSIVMMRFSS